MIAFKQKVIELDNALRAVSASLRDMNTKLPVYKAVTRSLSAEDARLFLLDIDVLETGLKAIELKINGDRIPGRIDQDGDYALSTRARNAAFDNMRATTNITGTSIRNYDIAADEFAPILLEVKKLIKEFEAMDMRLDDMGAPLTPGRLPDWKKK